MGHQDDVKPQCICKSIAGDNRECPWHSPEAMREYHERRRSVQPKHDLTDPDELKRRVDAIIENSVDDERAHAEEDALHTMLIDVFCPEWVKAEVARLNAAPFARWCA